MRGGSFRAGVEALSRTRFFRNKPRVNQPLSSPVKYETEFEIQDS